MDHDTGRPKTSQPLISEPVARAASHSTGSAPRDGWAAVVPELSVADIGKSLSFWCDLLGFDVAYDRPDARFAYLVRGHLQVMHHSRVAERLLPMIADQWRAHALSTRAALLS